MPTAGALARPRRRSRSGMLILYVVWGSTYLAIAVAVETIPPFLMAAVRFVIAGVVLLAGRCCGHGGSFVAPTRREWRDTTIVGALLLGGGMGMVAFGEQTIPSGITALLIALMPVWVAIFGRVFLGERLPRLAVVGIVVGFVGVAILVGPTVLGGERRARPARPGRRHRLADRLVARLAVRLASRGPAAPSAASRPAARCWPAPSSWRSWPARRRVRPVRPGGRLGRVARRVRLPRRSSAACSRSRPTAGCSASRRCRSSRRTPTSTRSWRSSSARSSSSEPIDAADARRRRGHRRRGRADRDRPRPDDGAGGQAVGRSQPCAGQGSQRSGRSSR